MANVEANAVTPAWLPGCQAPSLMTGLRDPLKLSCVTLGESLPRSGPKFSHLQKYERRSARRPPLTPVGRGTGPDGLLSPREGPFPDGQRLELPVGGPWNTPPAISPGTRSCPRSSPTGSEPWSICSPSTSAATRTSHLLPVGVGDNRGSPPRGWERAHPLGDLLPNTHAAFLGRDVVASAPQDSHVTGQRHSPRDRSPREDLAG